MRSPCAGEDRAPGPEAFPHACAKGGTLPGAALRMGEGTGRPWRAATGDGAVLRAADGADGAAGPPPGAQCPAELDSVAVADPVAAPDGSVVSAADSVAVAAGLGMLLGPQVEK